MSTIYQNLLVQLNKLFRHNRQGCQSDEPYSSLVNSGHTDLEARQKVSRLLGHNRVDVTDIYLASQSGEESDHE